LRQILPEPGVGLPGGFQILQGKEEALRHSFRGDP
jgi:hypothetical protein